MAATNGTMLGQFEGPSLLAAFTNPTKYDLLQIASNAGKHVIVSVSYNGVVNLNPTAVSGSGGTGLYTGRSCIIGRFIYGQDYTPATIAQAFSAAFPTNPSSLDIFQVVNQGGNISFWLDSAGVAHGS